MPTIPNREDDLARPRERKGGQVTPVTTGVLRLVTRPQADPEWEPFVRDFFDAFGRSGEADFYQDSDWYTLKLVCHQMNQHMKSNLRSAGMFGEIMRALGPLLATEGHRRLAHIELKKAAPPKVPASVTAIDETRRKLGLKT